MKGYRIKEDLIELDTRLSGLCDSIEFINNQILEGISERDIRVLVGTIGTLKHISRIYYYRYNELSGRIIDFIKEVGENE